jgi:hypothetical protein
MTATVVDHLADVPSERLEHQVACHAASLAAATFRWLWMIAELDRRGTWADWQCRSMAHWLSWRCALDLRTGREHVRVARALGALPNISAAFAAGEITYSKVKALTRVARPETDAELLETARDATASQLDRIVSGYAQALAVADRELLPARRFDVRHHDDGTVTISLRRLPGDAASTIIAAVEAALPEVPNDLDDTTAARLADAFEIVARRFVAPDDRKPRPVEARLEITERPSTRREPVDAARDAAPAGPPRLAAVLDGLPVSQDTARELLCDSSLFLAVKGEDDIVRFVRRATSIPRAARRRTERRDELQCRWPGCTNHRWLNVHHITWRSRHGNHATGNLVLLCPAHHRAVHRRGWEIVGDADGALVFVGPDGREMDERAPRLPRGSTLPPAPNDGRALAPRCYERMDLHWVVAVLAERHFPSN